MLPATPNNSVIFRDATIDDCSDLALLADMATRRLTSFLWGTMGRPGQSAFEVGRNIIRNDENHFTYFRNWRIAELGGQTIGALNGYVISTSPAPAAPPPEVIRPLNELKTLATGTWYISAAAIFAEYQGKGYGAHLLAEANAIARAAQVNRLTLMVGSFNTPAYRLYQRCGFQEWERRPFIPFPGSDEAGDWILMVRDLED